MRTINLILCFILGLGGLSAEAKKSASDSKVILQKEVKEKADALVNRLEKESQFSQRLKMVGQHREEVEHRLEKLPAYDIKKEAEAELESENVTRSRIISEYLQALELIPENMKPEECSKLVQEVTLNTDLEKSFVQAAWVIRIAQELCKSK